MDELILKFLWKYKGMKVSKKLEKEQIREILPPGFKIYYRITFTIK